MFTGLVKSVGIIKDISVSPQGMLVQLSTQLKSDWKLGDSIAVNGVCLTITKTSDDIIFCDISQETLNLTTIGDWRKGATVNLEPALKVGDELGGHWVAGHVDDKATVLEIEKGSNAFGTIFTFSVPNKLMKFIAPKGSIAIDGVSLTINQVDDANNSFSATIIPWTFNHTIFSDYKIDSQVNIEVDILARYSAKLMNNKI